MAHRKAEGTTKNGRDSNPRYLGVKINKGESVSVGQVILRQRAANFIAGKGVGTGKDYTLFALKDGKVSIDDKRKIRFDSKIVNRKIVSVA